MFVGGQDMQVTPSVFSCSSARVDGKVVAVVIGEIDRGSAGQFRNQLLTIAKEHPSSIMVDMANATLLDDVSLAVLVEVWQFTQEHRIEFTIKSPGPSIRRVFDIAPSGRLVTLL
jgi:anti-anti-sigma factor